MMSTQLKFAIIAVFFAAFGSNAARADWHRDRHGRELEWNRGHWTHDRHDGRLGWWWIVGSTWYFYDRPHTFIQPAPQAVIIQQAPPVVVQQQPPAPLVSPVLYYCKATGTQYPETMTCPGGWSTRTAETPPQQ